MLPLYSDVERRWFPAYTVAIIFLNLLIFAGWQQRVGLPTSALEAGLVPAELLHGDREEGALHLLTYMFMHGGWLHLLGNLWFLWVFGQGVEDEIGSARFLVFYLTCGVVAGMVHVYFSHGSRVPLVGASGAISGVLGAYLLLFPRARVMTLVPLFGIVRIMAIPAVLFLLVWIGLQVYSQAAAPSFPRQSAGVAYLAHIGGFAAGIVLLPIFRLGTVRREFGS